MKISKIFINYFLCLSLFLLSSCITKSLWGDKSYDDNITQFLVGSDARYVIFVSPEYHYIFTDSTSMLREILSLKQQGIITLNTKKTYIKLDRNNDITGYIIFEGPFDLLPREDEIKLRSLGLMPNKNGDILIKINLAGRRYSARYLGYNAAPVFSGTHTIKVFYEGDSNFAKGVGKAAITPVAVTLDAALLIGKVVVYPFKWVY